MSALDDVLSYPSYALIRLHGSDQVTLLGGSRVDHEWLSEIAIDEGAPSSGRPCAPRGDLVQTDHRRVVPYCGSMRLGRMG